MSATPWNDYQNHPTCGDKALLDLNPIRVNWILPSGARGLHGWADVTRMFPNAEEAIAAARRPMGAAKQVYVHSFRKEDGATSTTLKLLFRRRNGERR